MHFQSEAEMNSANLLCGNQESGKKPRFGFSSFPEFHIKIDLVLPTPTCIRNVGHIAQPTFSRRVFSIMLVDVIILIVSPPISDYKKGRLRITEDSIQSFS